jgi:hypothetical protein
MLTSEYKLCIFTERRALLPHDRWPAGRQSKSGLAGPAAKFLIGMLRKMAK